MDTEAIAIATSGAVGSLGGALVGYGVAFFQERRSKAARRRVQADHIHLDSGEDRAQLEKLVDEIAAKYLPELAELSRRDE